jgi:hypothetical protein
VLGAERPSEAVTRALELIETLAAEIGPRRPTSYGELAAVLEMREDLNSAGVKARLERFPAYASFAAPFGVVFALALAAGVTPRRRPALRSALAVGAALAAAQESTFARLGPSALVARRSSQNLVAEIESKEDPKRTLCLLSHLDSSRSGLMFHPALTPHLGPLVGLVGAAVEFQGLEPLLQRSRAGRLGVGLARAIAGAGALIVAERELRGVDVPGANDNASGVAACAVLATECARKPLQSTRLVLLMTGAEEAGVLGMRAFLDSRDTRDWLFLNFDGVGAAASLHFLTREGGPLRSWAADPALQTIAGEVATRRPELGLSGTSRSSGLPYDSTPVLARGGRAITISVQNGSIPDYHWPTDTADRIDPDVLGRALEAGREMIGAIDRGEADV